MPLNFPFQLNDKNLKQITQNKHIRSLKLETINITMTSKQLSPTTLNNKGVLLLEAGRYEDAGRCFKKASKTMMSVISTQKASKQQISCETKNSSPQSTEPSCPLPEISAGQSQKVKGVPQPTREPCSQPPRKRRRRSSMTSSFPVPLHNLGRPLWIQSKEQRKAALDSASLSATLLYNLGLSFNLMAMRKQKDQAIPIYRRALDLYKMSAEIMLRAPLSTTVQSPVFVVVLHNMSHVHAAMEEHKEAARYQGKLAHVLRLMAASRGLNEKQYESFYIKLLSLPKADSMAAAA